MHMKISSRKWCPFCLGLNVFMQHEVTKHAWVRAWACAGACEKKSADSTNFDVYLIVIIVITLNLTWPRAGQSERYCDLECHG